MNSNRTFAFTKNAPRVVSGGLFCCCCLLLLLPSVQPLAYVVIKEICGYFRSNSGKKSYNEIEHKIHHLSAVGVGVGNINIIAYFVSVCQQNE